MEPKHRPGESAQPDESDTELRDGQSEWQDESEQRETGLKKPIRLDQSFPIFCPIFPVWLNATINLIFVAGFIMSIFSFVDWVFSDNDPNCSEPATPQPTQVAPDSAQKSEEIINFDLRES